MTDVETLAERVRTVERAVTDGDHTFPAVDEIASLTERLDALERQVEELDERTAELEAATQALRGYVGNVRSVNERVEQRADTALAATERLERRLDEREPTPRRAAGSPTGTEHTNGLSGGEHGTDHERGADRSTEADRPRGTDQRRETSQPREIPDIDRPPSEENAQRGEEDEEPTDAGVLERIRSLL
jgi:ABC-type transporter Mla subunit MlaD